MTRDEAIGLLQKAYVALTSGDVATARTMVTEDVTWTVPGRGGMSGTVTGADAYLEKLMRFFNSGGHSEVIDVLVGADLVAAVLRNTAERHGRRLDVMVVNLYRFRDGLLAEQTGFYSDQYALDDFWSD